MPAPWYEPDSARSGLSGGRRPSEDDGGGGVSGKSIQDTLDSGDKILGDQGKPRPTPAPAPSSQQQSQPAPSSGGGSSQNVLGQPGTGSQEQQQTGAMPAGSFPDDSADAGNAKTGDPYLDELRSGKVAGSEDWRRFSNAQLKAWEQYYIGGGKFKNKYGDVVGKPPDRGPNTPAGMNGLGVAMGGGGGGGGGAAGGGGGGGGQSAASSQPTTGTVQARPDYKPETNYVTERNVAGAGLGGAMASPVPGQAPRNIEGRGGLGMPARGQPNPIMAQPRYVINQERSVPGGSVVGTPITRTGM